MRAARRLGFAAVAVAAAVTGCSSNGIATSSGPSGSPSTAEQSSSPPVPAASGIGGGRDAVLGQYSTFWQVLTPASRLPAFERRQKLASVSADPELRSLLNGIAKQRSQGHAFYGAARPHAVVKQYLPQQGLAVVDDCQDATAAGLLDLRTHRQLTRGVRRNHVVVTLHRGADEVWRVTFVSFPRTPC